MIRIANRELVFTIPGSKVTVLSRRAAFAHSCPKCGNVIHALLYHDSGEKLDAAWAGAHPLEINLKIFAEGSLDFIVPPEYNGSIIALTNGQVGQYFFDNYHFSQFGYRYHGRCKYSRAVFQFEDNPGQEAIRLLGILKALYGTDEPRWVALRNKVANLPAAAEMVLERVKANAGTAPDRIGNSRPVVLISKEDWDFAAFNELVDGVIALPDKE